MTPAVKQLITRVQENCEISDACHAGDYTMCIYLLRMREYYRWSFEIPLSTKLSHRDVGAWVETKETRWDALLDSYYSPIPFGEQIFDAFDHDALNQKLTREGLVYSAGYGRGGKPVFVLAELLQYENTDAYELYITGKEYARELTAPPAMSRGRTIFVRRESLRRMIWEMVDEWRWHKPRNAMFRAMQFHGMDADIERTVDTITEDELENVILHEVGEIVAGELLGSAWEDMLLELNNRPAEIVARAVRDNLADCLSALPALLQGENIPSIHFYFAHFHPLRKKMFPALDNAYKSWVDSHDLKPLKETVRRGREHWQEVAESLVAIYQDGDEQFSPRVESFVEQYAF
ncbi:MAG: hypothetical protein OER96_04260 [Gammaproteobacteria bacterium]|nr:hypothetical protein [Gammaproteobacteria bacterium]